MTYQPPEENFPYDPAGIKAVDDWGEQHPQAARTIKAATLCGALWLIGLIPLLGILQFAAFALAFAWCAGLIIMNWQVPWVRPLADQVWSAARRLTSWIVAAALGRLFSWRSGERRTAEVAAEEESVQRALGIASAPDVEGADAEESERLDTLRRAADAQLAAQRHAFATQLDVLNAKTGRTYHEEMQLAHLGRMIRSIDAGRFGPTLVDRPMAELGPVGNVRRGFLGSIASGGLMQWVAVGGVAFGLTGWGAAALQGVRLDHAKNALEDVRADLATSQRALVEARETANVLADNVREAAEQSRQTAETIETERARRVRAERERRRVQDAVDQARAGGPIDYGFGSMRDAGAEPLPGGGAGPAASDSR